MATYETRRYLLMTIDPVHIGTGGYRLGRVDNSIVREPGTNMPKIPGTSLHGAARSYAAKHYQNLYAAGKDHKNVKHPGMDPVCYTFGYVQEEITGKEGEMGGHKAWSGVVNVFDAHVVLFPVHSMIGPVWVGTAERIREAGFAVNDIPADLKEGDVLFSWTRTDPLNLGWLVLGAGGSVTITAPENWQGNRWDVIKDRIVLVQEGLFTQVVNSNLEIRTSVSIDPFRGAAEDGALFTYEALPRATFLVMDTVLDDYRESFPIQSKLKEWMENKLTEVAKKQYETQGWTTDGAKIAFDKLVKLKLGWEGPADVLHDGLKMIEWLGVGGMGTRGFGRIGIVEKPLIRTDSGEEWK